MRVTQLLPYAGLIVLGEAAIGSVPDVVAVREGGMGLGSALLMAQLAQVAGVVFGAAVAAYIVERWSAPASLVGGALLYYAGLISVGHQPSHLLGWVVVILAVAGAGLGMVLTAAFSAAATVGAAQRPAAVGLLLLASLTGALLVGNAGLNSGPPVLVIVAAVMVGGAVLIARAAGGRTTDAARPATGRGLSVRSALGGGGLLAIGVLATLWGIEPSAVSVTLLASTFGIGVSGPMDGLRPGLVLVGVVLGGIGLGVLAAGGRPSRETVMAVAATASVSVAVSGLIAIAGFAVPRDLSPPDSGGGPLGQLAGLVGGAAGLGIGAWLLARGIAARTVAIGGAIVLAGLGILLLIGLAGMLGESGLIGPVLAIAVTAFGGGLAGVALRLLLTEVPVGQRGLAAGGGVAAAAFGAITGLMIGAADGFSVSMGLSQGVPLGFVVVAAAALLAAAIVAFPGALRSGERGRADAVGAG
jgi:hypothetical protein